MKRTNLIALALCFALMLTLFGCSSSNAGGVYVQSVKDLMDLGGISPGDRFAGVLVSENITEIQKDQDKTVAELLVKEGDDVTEGQALFSYDTDQLQLSLDRQKLELEQLKAAIENYADQIEELKKERNNAASSDKLEYTVQIQSLEVELKEAQLNLGAKETAVAQSEQILLNATVCAPVTGRVQAVNDGGYDNYGNPLPYISIRQAGSYRVKGTIGELQMGSLMIGARVKILSRTDENQIWYGTVSLIDYENPHQGSEMDMYYGSNVDEMSSSSKYPFYVELEDSEGLMLGQHVYMELDTGDEEVSSGISISSAFFGYDEDGTMYVWAEGRNGLEKRIVTLGEYNMAMDTYEVLDGLTENDYIAFPDPELCKEGVPTTREKPETEDTVMEGGVG